MGAANAQRKACEGPLTQSESGQSGRRLACTAAASTAPSDPVRPNVVSLAFEFPLCFVCDLVCFFSVCPSRCSCGRAESKSRQESATRASGSDSERSLESASPGLHRGRRVLAVS